jgi:hypothetical protein
MSYGMEKDESWSAAQKVSAVVGKVEEADE